MAKEFKLPELGENVVEGTVAKVLVQKGDTIDENQPVLEVETDKAVVEIPSTVSGKVLDVKVKDGAKIKVGDTVFTFDPAAAGTSPKADAPAPASVPAPAPAVAAVAAPAPKKAAAPAGPPRLQVLERPADSPPAPAPAPAPAPQPRTGPVLASPSVRRTAREHNVDLRVIPLSDPRGRVTMQDIQNYLYSRARQAESGAKAPTAGGDTATATVQDERWGPVLREPMNAVRRKTAQFMEECWTSIPHVTQFDKADVTDLETVRKRYGKQVEALGGKLTVTSFILKALAEALKKFPRFNASIDTANEQVLLRQYYHIGVAADTEHGLLVPVIRNVDQKSITELSIELPELAAKARARKLSLEEMQGGTFTVSNLGGLGGTGFTPIISAPQVAILGVSRSQIEPVFVNGQFAPRTMLPLSLSYDHRVIDGADAARFLRWLSEVIEQPWMLHLES